MNASTPQKKSVFVNVIGWVLVALSALGLLMSFLQYIIVQVFYDGRVFESAPDEFKIFFGQWLFLFNNLGSVLLVYMVVCAAMLVGALGMISRRNWGRWLVVFLFCLQILFSLLRPFLMRAFMDDMADSVTLPDEDFPFNPQEFANRISLLFEVFTFLFSLLYSGFIGWIIYRLTRPAIAIEFR